jgi:acetoacetyl-CoA reductase/3-oxoacyl-[acyl-carrier protein] reductase
MKHTYTFNNKSSLEGKVALVTGGDRGIGKAIVKDLSLHGFKVAFTFYEKKLVAHSLMRQLKRSGREVMTLQLDVSDRRNIHSTLAAIRDRFGGIEVLVNNAGIAQEKLFEFISDEDWDRMLATNLRGPFMAIQEVLPGMVRQKWGRIINITSIGGQWGGYNQVHYAAAKAGLINLTRSIAKIYSKKGITCNAVAPGLVTTDMTRNELNKEEGRQKVKSIPVGRVANPEEVASVVTFLASNNASYITGQTINVNGGMYFA